MFFKYCNLLYLIISIYVIKFDVIIVYVGFIRDKFVFVMVIERVLVINKSVFYVLSYEVCIWVFVVVSY